MTFCVLNYYATQHEVASETLSKQLLTAVCATNMYACIYRCKRVCMQHYTCLRVLTMHVACNIRQSDAYILIYKIIIECCEWQVAKVLLSICH